MPQKKWQKMIFAAITVFITVHLFVFYNVAFIGGYGFDDVMNYGVPVFGTPVGIGIVILIEIAFAYTLEVVIGQPLSLWLAFRAVNPRENKPFIVETAVICSTVCFMCPAMSFAAVFIYNDVPSMNLLGFLYTWAITIFHNFPLALLSQLFFIQPAVRGIYGKLSLLWTEKRAV